MTTNEYALTEDSTLAPGDLIIEPQIISRYEIKFVPVHVRLKKEMVKLHSGLKTISYPAHIGFWGQHWGMLPFWRDNTPLEWFRVYEVQPPIIPFDMMDHPQWSQELKLESRTLGDETRETLTLDAGEEFSVALSPVKMFRLQFGAGREAPAQKQDAAPIIVKVFAESAGEKSLIFSQNMPSDIGQWRDMEIDISRFKDHPLKLIFATEGTADKEKILWSSFNLIEASMLPH